MKKLLLLAVVLSSMAMAQDFTLSVPVTRFTLPNGLNVILHVDHSTPTVCVDTWFKVGSANEKPGRTGFAHLFEHLMFMGSPHAPEGKFDEWLESVGGENNASTEEDRTNYFEIAPSNALALPLFLDSDRMAFLADAMTPAKVDAQRDVVKNERRQSYENRPYGLASETIFENMYQPTHPYHWPVIGSMKDLSAASYEDVVEFFHTYYVPNNASLCIAGDVDTAQARTLVEYWFSDVPRGKDVPRVHAPAPELKTEKRLILEDRVQLPRLYMNWHSPAALAAGDAELDILASVLTGGKTSRLYKRLVYDLQIAQDVHAEQSSLALGSLFQIVATARTGHTLAEIEKIIQEEIALIKHAPPHEREVARAVNKFEASFLDRMENVFSKADALNAYMIETGTPDYFAQDLARYKKIRPDDVMRVANEYLSDTARVVLSIVPKGKLELAAGHSKEVQ